MFPEPLFLRDRSGCCEMSVLDYANDICAELQKVTRKSDAPLALKE
jgi:hypothetical protein